MTATRTVDCNELSKVLCLALELSAGKWKLAFSSGFGQKARRRSIDAEKLLAMLLRYVMGETSVFSVVCVPSVAAEDNRQLQRELGRLRKERTAHINRIKSLLVALGLRLPRVGKDFPEVLNQMRMWDGQAVPPRRQADLLRQYHRLQKAEEQIREVQALRREMIREERSEAMTKIRRLLALRGIGLNSACLYVYEFFGWRKYVEHGQPPAGEIVFVDWRAKLNQETVLLSEQESQARVESACSEAQAA